MVPVVIIPCPMPEEGFSGWALQFRRIAGRNSSKARFRIIYAPEFDPRPSGAIALIRASLAYAFRCRRIISREKKPVSVLFPSFFLPNVLLALMLPRGIGYVLQVAGNELERGSKVTYPLRMAMICRARHIIALNAEQMRQLEQLEVPAERRHLIPVSVSPEFRPPALSERDAARTALGLSQGDWVVGSVGLLSERKQQRRLIEAVARLNRTDAVVVLCGPESGGAEADASYAEACRADAARLGVRMIMTGRRDDVRAVLWTLDVFALPSLSEGMPNAMLEALACGLPCVGSDIPGIRHLLMDGAQGELFTAGDSAALANALMRAQTADTREEMITRFRAEVIDEQVMALLT